MLLLDWSADKIQRVDVHRTIPIGLGRKRAAVCWEKHILSLERDPDLSWGRCSNGWSMLNGKCLFASKFNSNWTAALAYCRSFTGQLFTLSAAQLYSSITLSQLNSLLTPKTNYFLGLSEEPVDSGRWSSFFILQSGLISFVLQSGNWQWVDGASADSTTLNLFCANGSVNQLDVIFRTKMNCGMYRMDGCLARYTCQRADVNFICEKGKVPPIWFHCVTIRLCFISVWLHSVGVFCIK